MKIRLTAMMARFRISSSYSESYIVLVNPNKQIANESLTLDFASKPSLGIEVVVGGGCDTLRRSGVGLRNVDVDLGVDILIKSFQNKKPTLFSIVRRSKEGHFWKWVVRSEAR